MKTTLFTKLTAVLTLILALTACTSPAPTETVGRPLTVGQLADYFLLAADDYNTGADRTAILEGLTETEQATRLQMFVLASRAFGGLSAPTGNGKNTAPPAVDLTGVPKWSRSALENLSYGGILAASDLGLPEQELSPVGTDHDTPAASKGVMVPETAITGEMESAPADVPDAAVSSREKSSVDKMNAPVTQRDAEIVAQRFFQAFSTNLRDNFYATVNKGEMDALELPSGDSIVGGSSTAAANTDRQLHDLILGIVNSGEDYVSGSPEQKIRDFYNSVLAVEQRNAAGITPLRKYLDDVDAAHSFSELNSAIALTVKDLGNLGNGLFSMVAVTDTQDSSRKVMQLMTLFPIFSPEEYGDLNNEMVKAYREGLISQLVTAGESPSDAERHADGMLRMEKALAENATDYEELNDLKNQTKRYTPKSLDELMPQAKPSELFRAIGLKDDAPMQVFDDKQFAVYAGWFTEENLELFKAMQKIALVTGFSPFLSEELAKTYGYQNATPEEAANMAVQSYLSNELGQLYVERYFPSESKAEIEKMVQLMIDAFKTRIARLDWMEKATKQEAIKKLDAITVLIGYPDQWDVNNAAIKGAADGGSYFVNAAALEADKWEKMAADLDQPVDPRRFALNVYTVNAAASRNSNTLIFPAGIL